MTGRKIGKIVAIVAGAVVGLIAVVAILVKVFISPEMVKKTVLPKVSTAINRQVTLGDVSISLFTGIRLRDLTVLEKDGGVFLKAGAMRLSYQFWPLLSGRVVVDEVTLESPELRIVRNADGTFNFSDLMRKREEQPAGAPKEKGRINLAVAEVSVKDGKVALDDRKGVAGAPFAMEISGIELTASDVSMDREFPFKLKAALPGASVELSGKARQVAKAPAIDAELQFTAKELAKLVAALPQGIGQKLRKFSPAGALEAKLKLSGDVKQPKALLAGGEVKLEKVQLTAGRLRPAIAGLLILGRDSLSSKDLGVDIGGQRLAIDLKGGNLMARPVSLALGVSGKQLDLNQLLPEKTEKPGAPGPPKPEPGPLNLPVQAAGSVRIGKVIFRTLEVGSFSADWQLRDNVFTLAPLKGSLAGGSFSDSARIDMTTKGFRYSNKLNVQGVQAEKLVPAFAPKAAGSIYGTMSLTSDVKGGGTSPQAAKRNLTGGGSFSVTDGKLTGSGFVASLAAFLGSQELRVLRFSKFAGTYAIKNAAVSLDAAMDGSDARIAAAGKVGLDKSLDMGMEARFPPAIAAKVARGDIGSLLTDSQGWGSIPLRATGTVGAPKFGIDTAKMKGRVREKLQQKLQEKLYGKPAEGRQQPEGGLIDKTLKGIFGK